jgi:wyosine [tRNA(Phe)-imidazoG37] synthetase (radical SAM superfamily)
MCRLFKRRIWIDVEIVGGLNMQGFRMIEFDDFSETVFKNKYLVQYYIDSTTLSATFILSKIISDDEIENIAKMFTTNNSFTFFDEKRAQACVDYLNEKYNLILTLSDLDPWDLALEDWN